MVNNTNLAGIGNRIDMAVDMDAYRLHQERTNQRRAMKELYGLWLSR